MRVTYASETMGSTASSLFVENTVFMLKDIWRTENIVKWLYLWSTGQSEILANINITFTTGPAYRTALKACTKCIYQIKKYSFQIICISTLDLIMLNSWKPHEALTCEVGRVSHGLLYMMVAIWYCPWHSPSSVNGALMSSRNRKLQAIVINPFNNQVMQNEYELTFTP